MTTLHFSAQINATRETVWNTLLGLETYKVWTAPFCEGSYYEGSWDQGERIRFLAPNGDGVSSVIAENRLYEFVSIKHLGVIKGGVEKPAQWAPSFENYTLRPAEGETELAIAIEVGPEFEQYTRETWPKALAKIKFLAERSGDTGETGYMFPDTRPVL
jgi:hypothetical protein